VSQVLSRNNCVRHALLIYMQDTRKYATFRYQLNSHL